MFEQQHIAAMKVRQNKRPRGFGLRGDSATLVVQAALNRFPSSLPKLATDGELGSKTSARLSEFQQMYGLPVTGQPDNLTLQALGIGSGSASDLLGQGAGGGSNPLTIGLTAGAGGSGGPGAPDSSSDSSQSFWDIITLKGLRDAAAPVTQAAIEQAKVTGIWTSETALAAAKAGGDGAAAALKFLGDNGSLIAKLALSLGVGYGTALAISIGGAGAVVLLLMSSSKGRR